MKTAILIFCLIVAGCAERKCVCGCPNCGVECRNRCEADKCLLADPCCDKCICGSKPPLKLK